MKKINYLFLLLVMCICTTANAQGFSKKITAIGDPLTGETANTGLVAGNYYLLRNAGTAAANKCIYETEDGKLLFTVYNEAAFKSELPTAEVRASIVQLDGESGAWKFKFSSGKYMHDIFTGEQQTTSNESLIGKVNIAYYAADGATTTKFEITKADNAGIYLNAWSDRPVYHNEGGGNSLYEILPISVADIAMVDYIFEYKSGGEVITTDVVEYQVGNEYSYTPKTLINFYIPNNSDAITGTAVAEGGTHTIECTKTLPVECTTLDGEGKFTSTPKFYKLKIQGNNYLKYIIDDKTADQREIRADRSNAQELAPTTLWYFVETTSKGRENASVVNVYCLAEAAPLAVTNGGGEGYLANFGRENPAPNFELLKNGEGFSLTYPGSGAALNKYANVLKIWNTATAYQSDGCRIVAEPVDIDAKYALNPEGKSYVGGWSVADAGAFSSASAAYVANPTPATLNAYYDQILSASQTELDVNKYYRIISKSRNQGISSKVVDADKDGNITADNERHLKTAAKNENANVTYKDLATIWKFESKNNGEYYWLRNANTGLTISHGGDVMLAADDDNYSAQFLLQPTNVSSYAWLLKFNNPASYAYLNPAGGEVYDTAMGSWFGDTDQTNMWYIEEVNSVDIDITAAGWATLCLPFEVQIPTGVKAYIGGESNGSYLKLTEITGVIPANEPVLLEGAEDTYTFVINTTATADKSTTNTLSGTTVKRTGFSTETPEYMALSAKNGVGMYQSKSANIPANKAYYVPQAAGVNALLFSFGDETTGIESVAGADGQQEVFYDLNGRRVAKPTRGIYVTGNGKKVFFTK